VIDWHDRDVISDEFTLRSLAKEAGRVIEAACLHRFGTPERLEQGRAQRNGLIFQRRRLRQSGLDYRLPQESSRLTGGAERDC
jgi:putative transposase